MHHLTPTNLTTPYIDAGRNSPPAVPLGSQKEGRPQEEDRAEEEGCDQEEDRRQEEVNSCAASTRLYHLRRVTIEVNRVERTNPTGFSKIHPIFKDRIPNTVLDSLTEYIVHLGSTRIDLE